MNKIYQKRKELGKCTNCGNPARPGKRTCQKCADLRKLTFSQRRIAGVCTSCGRPTVPGKTRCEYHLEQRARIAKKRMDNFRQAGLCTNCGKRPPIEGKTLCQQCSQSSLYRVRKYQGIDIRESILERDNHQCQICESTENLTVHHKDGNGFGSDNPNHSPDNLITLCRSCHAAITKLRNYNRELAIQLILS